MNDTFIAALTNKFHGRLLNNILVQLVNKSCVVENILYDIYSYYYTIIMEKYNTSMRA